jgi:hypothetical protein
MFQNLEVFLDGQLFLPMPATAIRLLQQGMDLLPVGFLHGRLAS